MHAKAYKDLSVSCQLIYGKKFVDSLPLKPKDNVLDIGCGTGELAEYTAINKVPEGRVTAFDPDKQRIEIASVNFAGVQNLSFHVGTALEFLKDKKDLYDVIYSNVVIHWIPVEDRRASFQAVYAAAKPGGIIAHQYCEIFPVCLEKIMSALHLTDEDREIIDATLHCIPSDEMEKLVSDCGFEVVSRETIVDETKFKEIHKFLLWLEANFHGKIPFRKRFNKEQDVDTNMNLKEDSSILGRTDIVKIVLRKPKH